MALTYLDQLPTKGLGIVPPNPHPCAGPNPPAGCFETVVPSGGVDYTIFDTPANPNPPSQPRSLWERVGGVIEGFPTQTLYSESEVQDALTAPVQRAANSVNNYLDDEIFQPIGEGVSGFLDDTQTTVRITAISAAVAVGILGLILVLKD